MLRATALGSDGSLWSVCRFGLAVLAGLLAIPAVTSADEYNRAAMAPAALVVHYRGNSAGTGVPQANRVQPIPAYGPGGDYAGARQASFSQPASVSGPASAEPLLRAYGCTHAQGLVLDAALNEQFRGDPSVRIYHDQRSAQILVMAPESVQQQVAAQVQAVVSAASGGQGPAPEQPAPVPGSAPSSAPVAAPRAAVAAAAPAASGAVQRREYQLKNLTAGQLESTLRMAMGERWSQLPQAAGTPPLFRLTVGGGVHLVIGLDAVGNRVMLDGPPGTAYESCARLIQSLDAPKPADEQSRCLVSLTSLSADDVGQAVKAIQTSTTAANAEDAPPGPAQPGPPGAEEEQPDQGQVAATVPFPGVEQGAGLIGPVQIEMLEGLDVILIRGHKRDVQQVVEIIQQIEKLSTETEPSIVVHQLRHVNCESLATLIGQLYQEVFSARQGAVSITALVKPNALLLIGRPESVNSVVNLIQQLDRPVPPESQFRVFRLRYAPAETVQETIETFFEDREGLGARLRIIADFRSNSLIVQASPRDMLEVEKMIAEIDTRSVEVVNDLRVFKLRNSLAEDLQPILQEAIIGRRAGQAQQIQQQAVEQKSIALRFVTIDPEGQKLLNSGILTDVRVTADPRANALLVSAPPESMPLIEALIHQLDQLPVASAQIKVFTIVNGDAQALLDMLESLFGQTAAASEPPVRTGAGEGDSSLVSLRFAVDVRTNSIIASGSTGDLAVVEAILLRLDESEVRERKSVVYKLKNAPAQDVASAINQYLSGESQARSIEAGLFSTFEIFDREVVVVAEPVSNSLIVSATAQYYDEIARLVEELDERPPMVMIQVLIAEVALNNTEEFGIELGLQDSILFDRSLLGDISTITNTTQNSTADGVVTVTEQVITSATNTPGFLFNDVTRSLGNSGASNAVGKAGTIGSQGLSNFGVGRLNSELGFGGLVLSASSESVSMLLRALKEERRINVLSRPQVMTLDNQPAFIQVGQRVPRVTGTQTNEAGGLTNTVTLENVGLILGVTPRISPDGLVVMEIDAEKSEVGPEADGIPISISEGQTIRSPRINTTTAQTTVSALDGQTVVLGGLITNNKTRIDRRVPFLAEIPILGHLFRYQGYTSKRSELLIVMTPRIVESEQDVEAIKQDEAARIHWCLNDVLELHPDVAFRPRNGEWADEETNTIYPDGKEAEEAIPLEDIPLERIPLESIPLDSPTPRLAPPNTSGDARGNVYPLRKPGDDGSRPVAPATYQTGADVHGAADVDATSAATCYTGGVSPAAAAVPFTYSAPSQY